MIWIIYYYYYSYGSIYTKKKTEQNKIFLVQEEIIMTPNEMAKRYFAFIVIWK